MNKKNLLLTYEYCTIKLVLHMTFLHKFARVILYFLEIYFNFKEKEARTRIAIVRFGAQMDISNENKFFVRFIKPIFRYLENSFLLKHVELI